MLERRLMCKVSLHATVCVRMCVRARGHLGRLAVLQGRRCPKLLIYSFSLVRVKKRRGRGQRTLHLTPPPPQEDENKEHFQDIPYLT